MDLQQWVKNVNNWIRGINFQDSPDIRVAKNPDGITFHLNNPSSGNSDISQGTYICQVTGKSGAFYIVNVFAKGINNPVTSSGIYAFPIQLNVASTIPNGTWILCSDQSFITLPSGGI